MSAESLAVVGKVRSVWTMDLLFGTLIFAICVQVAISGRTFYISSSLGDDSRNFASAQYIETPWKSISRLNTFERNWLPGDSILFCGGETFFKKLC